MLLLLSSSDFPDVMNSMLQNDGRNLYLNLKCTINGIKRDLSGSYSEQREFDRVAYSLGPILTAVWRSIWFDELTAHIGLLTCSK